MVTSCLFPPNASLGRLAAKLLEPHQYVILHHVLRMEGPYVFLSGFELSQITEHAAVYSSGLGNKLR